MPLGLLLVYAYSLNPLLNYNKQVFIPASTPTIRQHKESISASSHIDATLLKQLPNLKMIANIGVGYNNIDMSAAQARGVIVSNTPDVLTETTADMAWALMFAAARRITESERWLRAGHWRGMILDDWLGMDIHGSTLGIIGMGRIGRAIARRAQGFNMLVLYHNRHPITETTTLHATWVEKNTILAEADHLLPKHTISSALRS